MELKCLPCISQMRQHRQQVELGQIPADTPEPFVKEAITLVPTWQQQIVGNQMVVACVTVPACMEHIEVREPSAEEKAIQGGRLLQARIDPS